MIRFAHRSIAIFPIGLILLTVSVLMLGTAASVNAATAPRLAAQVQSATIGGAAPAGGTTTSVYQPIPAGLPVSARVPSPGKRQTVQAMTDAQGKAAFQLSPGTYWVYIPQGAQAPGFSTAGAVTSTLPDGTPVVAWQQVSVPSGGQTLVSLTITFAQP
jgi:hypothetical protein